MVGDVRSRLEQAEPGDVRSVGFLCQGTGAIKNDEEKRGHAAPERNAMETTTRWVRLRLSAHASSFLNGCFVCFIECVSNDEIFMVKLTRLRLLHV